MFKIPIRRSLLPPVPTEKTTKTTTLQPTHPARPSTQPSPLRPNLSVRLQDACLNLSRCPRCSDVFVLSETDNRYSSSVTCTNCGNLSHVEVSTARTSQLAILQTALKDPTGTKDKLPNVEISNKPPAKKADGTSDATMCDATPQAA